MGRNLLKIVLVAFLIALFSSCKTGRYYYKDSDSFITYKIKKKEFWSDGLWVCYTIKSGYENVMNPSILSVEAYLSSKNGYNQQHLSIKFIDYYIKGQEIVANFSSTFDEKTRDHMLYLPIINNIDTIKANISYSW